MVKKSSKKHKIYQNKKIFNQNKKNLIKIHQKMTPKTPQNDPFLTPTITPKMTPKIVKKTRKK